MEAIIQYTSKLTIFTKTPILSEVNVEPCRTEELGIVELEHSQLEEDTGHQLVKRRTALANAYQALPAYGSPEFWHMVEEPDVKVALPVETLVKCARVAISCGDDTGRNRIIEVIFRRTQTANEYWAYHVLNSVHLPSEERNILAHDLYADLCERVIRALMDMKRLFWEENFQHCLLFERKHVYQAFMIREGRWHNQHADGAVTRRIPRVLIQSLDQPVLLANGESWEPDIEDEQAQQALLSVEQCDLPPLILHLPEKLKSVIWLIFWEGRTEKDAAQILGVSDRTVRNRLQEALKSLRAILDSQGRTIYG
jgi:RNA polymerase sigma factor (sigma-70 family)